MVMHRERRGFKDAHVHSTLLIRVTFVVRHQIVKDVLLLFASFGWALSTFEQARHVYRLLDS
jgi:hypothetical protein